MMLACPSAQIAQSLPPSRQQPGSDEERGASNPPVFSSLTVAPKPAFESCSRRRSVRLAKTHHCINGATLTLGHLNVGDHGNDDRRKSHHRDESEPIHKGRRYTSPGPFRQLPTTQISSNLAELKILLSQPLSNRGWAFRYRSARTTLMICTALGLLATGVVALSLEAWE